eukprot:scaffold91459_cov16-Prasinocladus_malaysianus.AAC.1
MPSFRMIFISRLLPAVSKRTAAEPPVNDVNRPPAMRPAAPAMQATQLLESTAEQRRSFTYDYDGVIVILVANQLYYWYFYCQNYGRPQ